jgi:hypothetical protein
MHCMTLKHEGTIISVGFSLLHLYLNLIQEIKFSFALHFFENFDIKFSKYHFISNLLKYQVRFVCKFTYSKDEGCENNQN